MGALLTAAAVGDRADEVGALRPEDVLPDPLDERIAGAEVAGWRVVAVHHDALERVCRGRRGQSGHLDVAEAAVREMRLEGFPGNFASEDEHIDLRETDVHIRLLDLARGPDELRET